MLDNKRLDSPLTSCQSRHKNSWRQEFLFLLQFYIIISCLIFVIFYCVFNWKLVSRFKTDPLFRSLVLQPQLISATEKVVYRYSFGIEQPTPIFRLTDYTSVDNITSLGMHKEKDLIFLGDSSGTIRRLNISTSNQIKASKTTAIVVQREIHKQYSGSLDHQLCSKKICCWRDYFWLKTRLRCREINSMKHLTDKYQCH